MSSEPIRSEANQAKETGLFVRAVQGKMVRRYGTTKSFGVTVEKGVPTWDTQAIFFIPEAEALRYRKEYKRACAAGALVPATRQAWEAQQSKQKELSERNEKTKEENQ